MTLVEGEKVLVQRYSDKGVEFEKYITEMVYSQSSAEYALRVARILPPGCILRLTQGRSMVTYRCGRFAGEPSVTLLRGWKPKLPLDPREKLASKKPTKTALHIRLYDTTDWGVQGSDSERDAYEQLVVDAIEAAYPGADVGVRSETRAEPRVVVTTRFNGRILSDYVTQKREEEIAEHVIAITRDVWDAGEFWSTEEG